MSHVSDNIYGRRTISQVGHGFVYFYFRVSMTRAWQQGKSRSWGVTGACSSSGWMEPTPTAIPRSSSLWEMRLVFGRCGKAPMIYDGIVLAG